MEKAPAQNKLTDREQDRHTNFVSIQAKLRSVTDKLLLTVVLTLLILNVLGGLGIVLYSFMKLEGQIEKNLIGNGLTLVEQNNISLRGLVEENAFSAIREIVGMTVKNQPEIQYGIYMDAERLPWAIDSGNYSDTEGEFHQVSEITPLNDSLSLWADNLDNAGWKKFIRHGKEFYEFAAPIVRDEEKLGVIRYGLSVSNMKANIIRQKEHVVIQLAGIFLFGLITSLLMYFRGRGVLRRQANNIVKPLEELADAAKTISGGDYNTHIKTSTNDETGILAENFETMRVRVKKYTDELEDLVENRTASLKASYNDLRKEMEERIQAETELKSTQVKLFHAEKLAGIGQLAAGVAHEINNPIGFVMSNFNRLEEYLDGLKKVVVQYRNNAEETEINKTAEEVQLDFILDDIGPVFSEIDEGLQRVKTIVQNLRDFSRVDSQEDFVDVCLNDNLESSLNMARNEIKYAAEVEKDYGDIGTVKCFPGEINQVFLNILVNAAQAIKSQDKNEQGKIRVKTWEENGTVYCKIANNGPPISKKVISRIFDPFFTTKEVGEGTGLGLNISYDIIVNKHKGDIRVESGEETAFIIALPKKQLEKQ